MMKTKVATYCVAAAMCVLPLAPARAGNEGTYSTFYGNSAGALSSSDSSENTFIGSYAGQVATGSFNAFLGGEAGASNTTGSSNSFLGALTGMMNTTGSRNTYLGMEAGEHSTGSYNVFVGVQAGRNEAGSNKLYIDNCLGGGTCTSPFIYGEFDNHLLKINGEMGVAANGASKSQLHFSLNGGDTTGGWLTSVLDNNFFVSSGARYDGTAGGWIQRSPDTNAVIAGSGGVGYRVFTHAGSAVGTTFTPTVRLHIDYSGQFGINTAPVAGHEIHTSSGAYLAGGTWTDASSRDYKERIETLSTDEALQALGALNPVKFRYKVDPQEQHVGFVAEDVPNLVARGDRKGVSPMDIVAVLTKVVQEKSQMVDSLAATVSRLETELNRLKSKEVAAQ